MKIIVPMAGMGKRGPRDTRFGIGDRSIGMPFGEVGKVLRDPDGNTVELKGPATEPIA